MKDKTLNIAFFNEGRLSAYIPHPRIAFFDNFLSLQKQAHIEYNILYLF